MAAYVQYDVKEKQIDSGWAHPAILQALAQLCGIELYIWRLNKENTLIPHKANEEDYSVYTPEGVEITQRTNLLFVNNNHFERIEFIEKSDKKTDKYLLSTDKELLNKMTTLCGCTTQKALGNIAALALKQGLQCVEKGKPHQAIPYLLKALNAEQHHPDLIKAILEAWRSQQTLFLGQTQKIIGLLPLTKEYVLSLSEEGTLRKWHVLRGSSVLLDPALESNVRVTSLSDLNDTQFVSGHEDGTIVLWNKQTSQPTMSLLKCQKKAIVNLHAVNKNQCISFDKDGLTIFDLTKKASEQPIQTLTEINVSTLLVLPKGDVLLGYSTGLIKYIDLTNGVFSKEIGIGQKNIRINGMCAIDETTVWVAYDNGLLESCDLKTGQFTQFGRQGTNITAIAPLSDTHLISANKEGRAKIWTKKGVCVDKFDCEEGVFAISTHLNKKLIFLGCEDGSVYQWQSALIKPLVSDKEALIKQHTIDAKAITFFKSKDGLPKQLGKGSYGIVYKGRYKDEDVAIKEVDKKIQTIEKVKKEFDIEVSLMLLLSGYPNLMSIKGVITEKKYILVMELMPDNSLTEFLTKQGPSLSLEDKWVLMMDITYGLLCLHTNHVKHRDLKADNILIKNKRAKIGDFGKSRQFLSSTTIQGAGTPSHMDPWLLFGKSNHNQFTYKCDMYSLGNVCYGKYLTKNMKVLGRISRRLAN